MRAAGRTSARCRAAVRARRSTPGSGPRTRSVTAPLERGRAEHLLDAPEGFVVVRRVLLLHDLDARGATGLARLPHDARDPRSDPEEVAERLLELVLAILHLLHPETLVGREREFQRLPV